MANINIFTVDADIMAAIFWFMIHDLDNFNMFGKFLMAYYTKHGRFQVKQVLQRLNWDDLYQYHNHYLEVRRDQYHGFIRFAVKMEVEQAMFYDSVQKLFLHENVDHHLSILANLSGSHFPSSFSFTFFRAIYKPFEREDTVRQMCQILNENYLRSKLLDIVRLLEEIYYNITEVDYLLPVYKFCPNARNKDPVYQIEGEPFGEELWYSLCNLTVEENYHEEGDFLVKHLTMSHIWNTKCGNCKLQLILFKILLGAVHD